LVVGNRLHSKPSGVVLASFFFCLIQFIPSYSLKISPGGGTEALHISSSRPTIFASYFIIPKPSPIHLQTLSHDLR